jgi:hypothetical protein
MSERDLLNIFLADVLHLLSSLDRGREKENESEKDKEREE